MSHVDHPLIRMLRGFEARVLGLALALADSPHARETVGRTEDSVRNSRALSVRVAAVRRVWFSTPVPLDAFLRPGNRIAILPPQDLRRVLAALALIRCRDSIRRCIDRDRRRALAFALGEQTLKQMQDQPAAAAFGEPLPEDLDADALAQCGWRTMFEEGACRNATLGNIVELGLASVAGDQAWQRMRLAHGNRADAADEARVDPSSQAGGNAGVSETSRFFSMAGDLFSEFQWLFG
ncbi:hypothetical protein EPN42_16150 [bacterium]|nr:MAG: hypothetical protein EPN42_16150 [bacterium]